MWNAGFSETLCETLHRVKVDTTGSTNKLISGYILNTYTLGAPMCSLVVEHKIMAAEVSVQVDLLKNRYLRFTFGNRVIVVHHASCPQRQLLNHRFFFACMTRFLFATPARMAHNLTLSTILTTIGDSIDQLARFVLDAFSNAVASSKLHAIITSSQLVRYISVPDLAFCPSRSIDHSVKLVHEVLSKLKRVSYV